MRRQYIKKSNKKSNLQEVVITGISDPIPSKKAEGGYFRYIYTQGLDPASLYEKMWNSPNWTDFVKEIKSNHELICKAKVITRRVDGVDKTFITCDRVPDIIYRYNKTQKELAAEVKPIRVKDISQDRETLAEKVARDNTTLKDLIDE